MKMTIASKLCRAVKACPYFSLLRPQSSSSSLPIRSYSSSAMNYSFNPNPVSIQMINYAISLAHSPKSGTPFLVVHDLHGCADESYAQGLLVLEQCHSTQADDDSKAAVLLAMATLLSERGRFEEAIEKVRFIQSLTGPSLAVRVAATEALVGLCLQLGNDDSSLLFADEGLQLFEDIQLEHRGDPSIKILDARAKVVKGLVELTRGNVESASSCFEEVQQGNCCSGNVALSYGEFLHGTRKFAKAKELYQQVIKSIPESKGFGQAQNLDACNMIREEVLLAATCGLGQLEGHLGNFGDAEEMLTTALKEAEEYCGSRHPKVGVVLTCIALMYRCKAMAEHSSSLLIQEGLFRRALELLEAPPLETEGAKLRSDVVALARGGYADVLIVQQNRRAEGERMKRWAESAWRNRRLSLADALELSASSPSISVIDCRTCRAL